MSKLEWKQCGNYPFTSYVAYLDNYQFFIDKNSIDDNSWYAEVNLGNGKVKYIGATHVTLDEAKQACEGWLKREDARK